jgi:hypothetical protein
MRPDAIDGFIARQTPEDRRICGALKAAIAAGLPRVRYGAFALKKPSRKACRMPDSIKDFATSVSCLPNIPVFASSSKCLHVS